MSPLIVLGGIAALLMVFGAGIALVAGGNRAQVDERLEQFVVSGVQEVEETAPVARSGPDVAERVDKLLSGRSFFEPIKRQISRADVKLKVSEYLVLVFLSGIGVAAAAYMFFDGQLALVVIGFFVGLRIPRWYLRYAANRRINAFNNQLGDVLNLWVNALRSGYSVLQAMETIATEMPPPASREFERVVQEVRLGLDMEQALMNMHRRVPSDDLDLVITAVNIQREVGGNLAEVLDTISFTIRERVRIKGEIRTLTAQGRISGWVVSLLPIGLGLILYAINPEYVSQIWVKDEPFIIPNVFPCGWLVLGIGLGMIGLGVVAIRKIVDIEV
ncbi:MAG: secretion system protein [Chloroflexi bacterium]|nr:MAG: secretion system protein [Chloroflexota bacterium]